MEADPLAAYRSRVPGSTVYLESSPKAGDYRRRRGFYQAAVLLLETAVGKGGSEIREPLIWPALYSFRHYMELTLKMLARDAPALISSVKKPGHRLEPLWKPVRAGVITCFGASADEEVRMVDEAIAVLNAIDEAGDGLRYSTTIKGQPSVRQDLYLDPGALLTLFVRVERVLEDAETGMDAYQDLADCWAQ